MPSSALVSTAWLHDHLDDPDVRILDSSWYLPAAARDPHAEHARAHIPGARFFDIDAVADHTTALPHMLPSPEDFAAAAAALHHVVVYDGAGVVAAARAWWTFRAFGHAAVSVLQGGLPKWQAEGRPLTADAPTSVPVRYRAAPRPSLVRTLAEVRAIVAAGGAQLVDARSEGRFRGEAPEPRPGLVGGHIPRSLNLPFEGLLDPQGGLRPTPELRARFTGAGVALEAPVVTTCGSGITAALLALALFELGRPDVPVYDGSWAEWGGRDDTEIEL